MVDVAEKFCGALYKVCLSLAADDLTPECRYAYRDCLARPLEYTRGLDEIDRNAVYKALPELAACEDEPTLEDTYRCIAKKLQAMLAGGA